MLSGGQSGDSEESEQALDIELSPVHSPFGFIFPIDWSLSQTATRGVFCFSKVRNQVSQPNGHCFMNSPALT